MRPRPILVRAFARLVLRTIPLLYRVPFMTTKVSQCPICGGKSCYEARNICTRLDRCTVCGHVYARRLPQSLLLHLMYRGTGYWCRDRYPMGISEVTPGPQWTPFLDVRIGILRRVGMLNSNGGGPLGIFEIGCSEGMLLYELKRLGHHVRGCEMNHAIAEAGSAALDVDIENQAFEAMALPDDCFDAVISFHTLEHVRSPRSVFDKIVKALRPSGAVLIEVPCGKEEYPNTDHLHFFSRDSLERLLRDYFQTVELLDNSYRRGKGPVTGSLYGFGKQLRP